MRIRSLVEDRRVKFVRCKPGVDVQKTDLSWKDRVSELDGREERVDIVEKFKNSCSIREEITIQSSMYHP